MEDMVIKGTGNSRWLKSVANIMTLYPTYESFAEALAAGTFPIDLNGINPAGVETPGTRLNKANLLTDALCTALGISTTSTPTQALSRLNDTKQGIIVSGSYIGDGAESSYVPVGFHPKAVLVFGLGGYATYYHEGSRYERYGGLATINSVDKLLAISGNGFYVYYKQTNNGFNNFYTNMNGELYNYLAFP